MWWIPLAAAGLQGISSLIGNNQSRIAGERAADASNKAQEKIAKKNIKYQKEFAKNGIKWRMEDAQRSGVNPLYAMGAQTQSFSPISVGSTQSNYDPGENYRNIGNTIANAGQDIGRSISASRTQEEKLMAAAQIQSLNLDNQIKATQLKNLQLNSPNFPGGDETNFIPGQGNSTLMKVNPSIRTASQPGRPAQEAGWRPDVSYSRTDTGLTPMVPESLSESLEDDILGKLLWRWRNQMVPNFDSKAGQPPKSQLPKGATHWQWSHRKQEFQPGKAKLRFGNVRTRW